VQLSVADGEGDNDGVTDVEPEAVTELVPDEDRVADKVLLALAESACEGDTLPVSSWDGLGVWLLVAVLDGEGLGVPDAVGR